MSSKSRFTSIFLAVLLICLGVSACSTTQPQRVSPLPKASPEMMRTPSPLRMLPAPSPATTPTAGLTRNR
ncbi:o-spanin [Stenotrophomonas phage Salva]|uniref:O-spanin n=1 Tax=Stenotrophomonas phage Salva TaxID=2801524 RepID=A0A7U3WJW4_9CAUD|nr:o-spanin [Stenotrophomonas phage Salva]QQM18197.1 o-spanin [Stenotrophomonas phage Salva]